MVEITLSIPDDLYEHATRLSKTTQLNVTNILTDALAFTLPTIDSAMLKSEPVSKLNDKEVNALADSQMPEGRDKRLGTLLQKQREQDLSIDDAAELLSLMLVYYSGWWRKTEALVEAVKRGLRQRMEP